MFLDLRSATNSFLPSAVPTIPLDLNTILQHFGKHSYYTVSLGKIFHNRMPDRVSFDEPDPLPKKYMTPELIDRDPVTRPQPPADSHVPCRDADSPIVNMTTLGSDCARSRPSGMRATGGLS